MQKLKKIAAGLTAILMVSSCMSMENLKVGKFHSDFLVAYAINDIGSLYDTMDKFTLSTYEELNAFAELVSSGKTFEGKTVKLSDNFETTGELIRNIGNDTNPFKGTFDGNGQTIVTQGYDLFYYVSGARICNLTVEGDVIPRYYSNAGKSNWINGKLGCTGSICFSADNDSVFENCTNKCNIDLECRTDNDMSWGGIVGIMTGGSIVNCYKKGSVNWKISGNPSFVGGICGRADGTIIENCFNEAKFTLNPYPYNSTDRSANTAGICGYMIDGSIVNCGNKADINVVTCGRYTMLGGICAFADNINIENCFNTGNLVGDNNRPVYMDRLVYVFGICAYGAINRTSSGLNRLPLNPNPNNGYELPNTTVKNCYNTGLIDNNQYTTSEWWAGYSGGIACRVKEVTNCYNAGTVMGARYQDVGVLFYADNSSNCYSIKGEFLTKKDATEISANVLAGKEQIDGKTLVEILNGEDGTEWKQGILYPVLEWQSDEPLAINSDMIVPQSTYNEDGSLNEISVNISFYDNVISTLNSSNNYNDGIFKADVSNIDNCCQYKVQADSCENNGFFTGSADKTITIHGSLTDFIIDKEATCTENGSMSKHCLRCDEKEDVQIIQALGHDFDSDYTIDKEATCTEEGSMSKHCSRCDEKEDVQIIPVNSEMHNFSTEFTIDKEANCTEEGSKSRHCLLCDAKTDITPIDINPDAHVTDDYTVDIQPTCYAEGSESKHCKYCDEKIDARPIPMIDHKFAEEFTVDLEPTCMEKGSESQHCIYCGEKTNIREIPIKPHTYSANGTCMYCNECKSVIENGEHNYINGVCESCHTCFAVHKTGTHQFLNGKCECCNECESVIMNNKHDFVNGKCTSCGEIETDKDGKPINQPEITYQGSCGDNATYEICKNGTDTYTLYIKGYGDTIDCDYAYGYGQPWYLPRSNGNFNNSKITKVEIEDGITRIGDYLLCISSITEITIPDSVKSIGNNAFWDCSELTSITLPNSLVSIDNYAFYNCKSLASVSIPCSVTKIGEYAFYYCKSLASVSVPCSVTEIGEYAFNDCSKSLEIHTVSGSKASELIDGYGYKNITDLTHKYNGGICTSCGELKNHRDAFTAASLTLTDGVIINFKTILEEDAVNDKDAYIHFTSEYGIDTKVMLSEGKPDGDSYIFSLYLRPDQMADEITATIVYGDGTEGSSVKYSVIKYAENMKGKVEPKMAKLINAMLNYGAATQKYTNHNTANLADFRVFDYFSPNVSISDDYKMSLSNDNGSGAKVKGAYLSIEANITLKVKYEITGNISDYKFTCNGKTLSPYKDGTNYWVDIKNITPQDFDEMYDIVVTNKTNGLSRTLNYSALTYAKSIIENTSAQTELADLMKAMYYYNQAANAYIG